eukprot:823180-Pelagomonas_calceolata.AAC.1
MQRAARHKQSRLKNAAQDQNKVNVKGSRKQAGQSLDTYFEAEQGRMLMLATKAGASKTEAEQGRGLICTAKTAELVDMRQAYMCKHGLPAWHRQTYSTAQRSM